MNADSYLSSKNMINLFDFYNLYLVDVNTNLIDSLVQLDDVVEIEFSNPNEDYLPGYNFYILTSTSLHLFSVNKPEIAYLIVKGLQSCRKIHDLVRKNNLLYGFKESKCLIQISENFDTDLFFKNIKTDLFSNEVFVDEVFNLQNFTKIFSDFRKFARILKYHPILSQNLQNLLLHFLKSFVNEFQSIRKKLKGSDFIQIFKVLNFFNFYLEKLEVHDLSLKKYLMSINYSVFQQLNNKVMVSVNIFLTDYFIESKTTNSYFRRNFYMEVFDIILTEFEQFKPFLKFNIDTIQKTVEYVNQECFHQVVYNTDVSVSQLIHLLNSCCRFSKEFFDFLLKINPENLDSKFANSVQNTSIQNQINNLMQVLFNEIEIRLEDEAMFFFDRSIGYSDLVLIDLLNNQLFTFITKLKKNFLLFLFEICMNNLLNFLLRLYFLKLFESLSNHQTELNYHKRLCEDKEHIMKFFEGFIESSNLRMQLENIEHVMSLLINSNQEQLITSLIKLDVFFNNELLSQIIAGLIEKNFNISIKVEEEVLAYFVGKRKEQNSKSIKNSQMHNKSLLNNSFYLKKYGNTIFLNQTTLSIFKKMKLWVYRIRAKSYTKQRLQKQDVKLDFELVNNSVNEQFLENHVKVVFLETEEFDAEAFTKSLKVV